MNKTQYYLSQCAEAASKSPMCFTLGAIMVKGGKVISSGYNHHRPHYDGAEVRTHGHRKDGDRGWDARRRDPRANGADLYVARFTKNGMGSAKPCWRCIEWCRWAGVKRIFHWDADEGRFIVVKVNDAQSGQYETHADIRLFAGLSW
ncbi:hypothetical protein C8T65DRAFT_660991 [Cerioporus squamosus]|nr:hypothetical protein C8T65DRAFT_660991 [Cerioporus squamosus]